MTENEMLRWHHQLDGHKFEYALGVGDGQGSLACCSPWGLKVQFSSVTQSCPTLCNPKDCNTPGFPVLHQLPDLAQTHVHRVSDIIQRSHPVLPFSSCLQSFPASESFPKSQFFSSGGQSIGATASVLPMSVQG